MTKRQYDNDYPSVTQVLDILRKQELENWFKFNTPQFIFEESEKGKTIGTQTHKLIQAHIEKERIELETDYPSEVKTALDSFFVFKKTIENDSIKLHKAEISLTSEKYKYNGTLDCYANNNRKRIIMDWKTGKCIKVNKTTSEITEKEKPDVYDSMVYQVCAYAKLYEEIFPLSEIDEAMVVVLAKDKTAFNCQAISKKEIEFYFKNIFLPALKIFKAKKGGI